VLHSTAALTQWGQNHLPEEQRPTLFNKIGEDTAIIKVVLLLTGALHGTAFRQSFFPSVRPAFFPSVRPPVRPSFFPSFLLSVRPSVLPSVRPCSIPY
jgi:hypothetical protein